ncbi:MAG: MgtC/SapB family protein [Actinomycetota bacterium]
MAETVSLDLWELSARILVAAALGGLIGFEREFADQPAGFRTHILVSVGAALFTIVGAYGVESFIGGDQAVRFDPTRVAAQVVTGIGFLGAGAILQQGVNVRGLTTAASLWVTAAVGTAVGLGYWGGAVVTAVTTVAALYGLKPLGHRLFRRLRRGHHRFILEIEPELRLSDIAKVVERANARTESFNLIADDDGRRHVVVTLQLPASGSLDLLAQEMTRVEGVRNVDLDD